MINLSKKLIGNNDLENNLINLYIKKKLSNSLIISGPKGIGKATFSFSLINNIFKTINTTKDNTTNLIYNNTHPNIRYVSKDFDEKNNKFKQFITIDQIRNLENFLYQSSFTELPKFILIDSVNDLNSNSANAMLKVLEEPKKNTFFILITHQLSNILPTIRSRCVKFNLQMPKIDQFNEIISLNNENIQINDINFLYYLSNGSPGLALDYNNKNFHYLFDYLLKILSYSKPLTSEILEFANTVGKYTNEDYKNFLTLLKFILMTITKNNLNVSYNNNLSSKLLDCIKGISNNFKNSTLLLILKYLNDNESDLFTYNLDKKIFCVNIFTPLKET